MTKTRQRKQNLLTARAIEATKEAGRYSDGNGLYLVVRDGGSRQWTFRNRREGKLKEMGRSAPAKGVTLAMARDRRNEARAILAGGRDPLEARRQSDQQILGIPTFGAYALALVERIEEGSPIRSIVSNGKTRCKLIAGLSGVWRLIASTLRACWPA